MLKRIACSSFALYAMAGSPGCAAARHDPPPLVWSADPFDRLAGLSAYLRDVGVPISKGNDGSMQLTPTAQARNAIETYQQMLSVRIQIIAQNLTEARTNVDVSGKNNPYRRQVVQWGKDHKVEIVADDSPFPQRYEPGNPVADAKGYVRYPNVEPTVESVDLARALDERQAIAEFLANSS
jgi:flagellar basal body rod protein FlgC